MRIVIPFTISELSLLIVGYFLLGVGLTMIFGMLNHPWGNLVMASGAILAVLGGVVLPGRPYRRGLPIKPGF